MTKVSDLVSFLYNKKGETNETRKTNNWLGNGKHGQEKRVNKKYDSSCSKNAKRIIKETKCDAVKLEGGSKIAPIVSYLIKNKVAVFVDENIDTGIQAVDEASVEFGYTTRLSMVSIGASTASATVQLSKNVGNTNIGKGIAVIDLVNDGTGYTLPPLIGISSCLLYTSPSPRD